MSRKMTIIIILLLLASFEMGVFIGMNMNKGASSANVSSQNTYQAGWDAAKKRLADSGFFPAISVNNEIKNISGQIVGIKDNKIALKVHAIFPLDDPSLDNRIITLNNTKIYQLVQKNTDVYQKEMKAFNQAMQERFKNPASTSTPAIVPPDMFVKNDATISDLKVGEQITVTSDANIANAKNINATEISVQYVPIMPPISSTTQGMFLKP